MESSKIRFDNQVVVITGAGGGLGKSYALQFAARGAKVVVNDLGGSSSGEGNDVRAADQVVQEIKNFGGSAVADYHSVEDGEKVIQTALDNFGTIDILVNNAGILRDRSFARISDADWDLVHNVHLRGSFLVTRAAFPHMKNKRYGRIIMTTSVAGIYGNFGQANYSAAKLGLLGLSNTVSIEGARYNIQCNTIAPMGGTRLTEGILPEDLFKEMKPELIAPIVLWLCHKDCEDTGGLYEAAGGWFGKYQWARSKGHTCRKTLLDDVTPENVRDNWEKICDLDDPLYVKSNNEAAGLLASTLIELKEGSSNKEISVPSTMGLTGPLSAVGATLKRIPFTYDYKNLILYALGVGVSIRDEGGLQYLFEGNESFGALPTFIIIPAQIALMKSGLLNAIPGWEIDFTKLLHGEQFIEWMKPLEASGTLTSDIKITDVLDKGSGASLLIHVDTYDERKELVAVCQFTIFIVGEGGFGGPRNSERIIPLAASPQRTPDVVHSFETTVDQAALYRLNGDFNPLHIDPDFAAMGGFDRPILHGLVSFGVAARAVLQHFCDYDASKFKAIKTRFAKPVIPGQTLVTSMWKEGSRVHFETKVRENSSVCLSGGYVDLNEDSELKCDAIFRDLSDRLMETKISLPTSKGLLLWKITHGDEIVSRWTFDLKNLEIYKGEPKNGQKSLSTWILEEENFLAIFEGTATPQNLFSSGKLRMKGLFPDLKVIMSLMVPSSKL